MKRWTGTVNKYYFWKIFCFERNDQKFLKFPLRLISFVATLHHIQQAFSNFICWRPQYLFLEISRPFKKPCDPLDLKILQKRALFGNYLVKFTQKFSISKFGDPKKGRDVLFDIQQKIIFNSCIAQWSKVCKYVHLSKNNNLSKTVS